METVLIAFGGNLGDSLSIIREALKRLGDDRCTVERVSSLFQTAPIGTSAGQPYLNGAAVLRTAIEPEALLARLQQLEAEAGRVRDVPWGPRSLDLDIIAFGDRVIDTPALRIPHPACLYRRFVLDPVAEIAADLVHPAEGVTFGQLLANLQPRPLPLSADDAALPFLKSALASRDDLCLVEPGDPRAALHLTTDAAAKSGRPTGFVDLSLAIGSTAEAIASILDAATDIPRIRYDASTIRPG
ncbi:2-amino-4-hydroxy-6-hydroxymethyldihydropteridine diphosphokinase [Stratiformator vulcanicus]|uniref:2-amino-4-hydroxy-6-hydroxymethyldihydropteridine pyrophosphokinase n=1 Tax=Stratiformator vulcanicus TaxID=2527980 RepID=A0A517R7S0_9PLAN|nr:2-amino-4-hydroxy-6-hydroxymethyldihydropteridine diphosphokinase [Stratiformator vulcanicus]QDT39915.1 2-amino-4-hydroxy-6-hydroxymethyldihydropteridine pyrophosphokinase [Stratiformator vulcanicus]